MAKKRKNIVITDKRSLLARPIFAKFYALFAVGVLLATTFFWAWQGAEVHEGNADQLNSAYLFESWSVFRDAQLPDQHTFLMKWPLFLIIKAFGATSAVFTWATVLTTLLTVALFAFILYRIERQHLLFGTLCLGLASVLLLIPAQPYPGGLLPVNMAMISTRNLEYIVFLGSLMLLARSQGIKNWRFWTAGGVLGLLVASDKLFLTLSIGGAVLAAASYAIRRNQAMLKLSLRWLGVGAVGGSLGLGLLWVINAIGVTDIVDGSFAGPYGIVHNLHDIALGCIYAVLSLLTNFGSNPFTDTRLLGEALAQTQQNLLAPWGMSLMINGTIAVGGIAAVGFLVVKSFARPKKKQKQMPPPDAAFAVTIMLFWTTIAAIGAFVLTKHYYPVDARYLAIAFFAAFMALAVYTRHRRFHAESLVALGAILVLGIGAGLSMAHRTHTAEMTAMRGVNQRNHLIAQVLRQHPVDALVGDYWRVFPTKLAADNKLQTIPLADCTNPRSSLTSKAWQIDLRTHSFAYLLSFEPSLAGTPRCSLEQIVQAFGQPNTSVLIAGSQKTPREILLFYDKGAGPVYPDATVTPVNAAGLPSMHTTCDGPTIMNVVAHQDDDLLFMSPDLLHTVQAGHCIRTVYITSGDAGGDRYYWLGREEGSKAAYNAMLGSKAHWVQRIVKLPNGQFVSVASPEGNNKVSLIFMRLADGNLHGQGFDSYQHESLSKLESGYITKMHTADRQSTYSADQLRAALASLMDIYRPATVRTQSTAPDYTYPDHSDHATVGHFTTQAYRLYIDGRPQLAETNPIAFYIGYPIHNRPSNVEGTDFAEKQKAFFAYAKFDNGVCHTPEQCEETAYGPYLRRQYLSDH